MRSFSLLAIVFGFLSFASPLAQAGEVHVIEKEEKTWTVPPAIFVRVVDENKRPVSNASVEFYLNKYHEKESERVRVDVNTQTDASGKATVELDTKLNGNVYDYSSLDVKGSGLLLPQSITWNSRTNPADPNITIPEKLDIVLKEGKMVRLQVVDENNNGIAGVEIEEGFNTPIVLTNAEGYWEFGPVAKDYMNRRIHATFRHPDFETVELQSQPDSFPPPPDPTTVQLKRGKEILGTLNDEQGKPVGDATIFVCGDSHFSRNEFQSDSEGKFHLKGLLPSQQLIIIRKKGMVEKVLHLAKEELGKPLNLTMEKGKTLRIKFETDFPGYAAYFGIAPPFHILENFEYRPAIHHSINDRQGGEQKDYTLIEWEEAPDEEVEYKFAVWSFGSATPPYYDANSFRSEYETYKFRPREEPYTIKVLEVPRPQIDPEQVPWPYYDDWKVPEKMQIVVLDETAQPKQNATVQLHLEFHEMSGSVIEKNFQTDDQGLVDFDFSKIDNGSVMRFFITVEAENCRTEEMKWYSDFIRGNRKTGYPIPERLEILLYPRDKTVGIVRDDEGNPIAGAKIKLISIWNCTLNGVFGKDGGSYNDRQSEMETTTDASGVWSFDLIPQEQDNTNRIGGRCEFVVGKEGFISKHLSSPLSVNGYEYSRITTLHRTKLVSGTVVDSTGNPISDIRVSLPNDEKAEEIYGVNTDADGKFVFNIGTFVNNNQSDILFYKCGMTPIRETLDLTQNTENLRFTMLPGKDLKLRFVDKNGKGIPNVSANMYISKIETTPRRRFGGGSLEVFDKIISDARGVMVLKNAPNAEMEYLFKSPGNDITGEESYQLKPTDEEQTITLVNKLTLPMHQRRGGGKSFSFSWNNSYIIYQE